jgi:hypothetical protein
VNGKLNGWENEYNDSGKIISKTLWIKSSLSGTSMDYYDNGALKTTKNNDEMENSVRKNYDEYGELEEEFVNFKDTKETMLQQYSFGQLISIAYINNTTGKIEKHKSYKFDKSKLSNFDKERYAEKEEADNKRYAELQEEWKRESQKTWKAIGQVLILTTESTTAYLQFKENPTIQSLDKFTNVAVNNFMLPPDSAAKLNLQILSPIAAASTNGGSLGGSNGGSAGAANGNSPQAAACAKQEKEAWESTPEYMAYMNNLSVSQFQQRYAILAQKKLIDLTLQNCSSFLTQTEIQAWQSASSSLKNQFYQDGGYNGLESGVSIGN